MEISFHTEELLHLCVGESVAGQLLDVTSVEALRNRLSDIRAADSVHELLAGRPEARRCGNKVCYRLQIAEGTWLTIIPNHNTPRELADGTPDWGRVRRVRVVAVGI